MPLAPAINVSSPPPHLEGADRLFFALSDTELRLFFPSVELEQIGGYWENVRGMGHRNWGSLLEHRQPRILVTGWSTPALDAAHTTIGSGSIDYVCHVGGSVRHLVSRDMLGAGLKVSNWGGIAATHVAEHALLLVLALLRDLPGWREFMLPSSQARPWKPLPTRSLVGKRVSIHGFGAVAREFIRLARPFSPQIRAFSPGVSAAFIKQHGVAPATSLVDLAREADVFVTCEALTPDTARCITAGVLSALPHGAIFVNVGRGAIVDEEALVAAARARNLRVGSDVFTIEPVAADSPFLSLPGAIVSPHVAGPVAEAYAECGAQALANIARYRSGQALENLVTPGIFDRST